MFAIGTRIGDYEILGLLQSSRKESVFRVRNVVADRVEVLKLLPDHLQRDQQARERFYREIKLHARLAHPNLVTFYHASEIEGITFMTTEYLEGVTTLAQHLAGGVMPMRKAIDLMSQVLAGLAQAHRQNLIHREVTPDNILILPDGQAKLGGFGLVKQQGDVSLTAVGTTLGCVDYMAPEQIKGAAELDGRTDIYAAGCVLYEMLIGRKPFESKSQFEVMACHVQRDAVNLHTMNASIPRAVGNVVARAMAKNPSERYANAETFAAALHDASFQRREVYAAQPRKVEPERPPAPPAPIRVVAPPAAVSADPGWRLHVLAAGLILTIVVLLALVLQ